MKLLIMQFPPILLLSVFFHKVYKIYNDIYRHLCNLKTFIYCILNISFGHSRPSSGVSTKPVSLLAYYVFTVDII
jgi:hypothetical protein